MAGDVWAPLVTAFATSIGTLGPIGVAVLLGWGMWLRFGTGGRDKSPPIITPEDDFEDRLLARRSADVVQRIENAQVSELAHLTNIVQNQARIVEVLDRIEKRMAEHDHWERNGVAPIVLRRAARSRKR